MQLETAVSEQAVEAFMQSFWGAAAEFVEPSHVKAALTAALPFMGVGVRKLEWTEYHDEQGQPDRWDAVTCTGDYYFIGLRADGYTASFDYSDIGTFDTLDAAKAAAQADYDQRIRSALIASDHGDYRRGLEDAARVCDAGAEKRAKQYEDWPKDQFVQKERFRVGAQQSKILAAAIRSLSPDSQPAPAPAPAFWLVHSKGGFPFGLFKTEEEAKNNLLRNPLRVITPLYTAPVSQPAPAEREWLPIESAPKDGAHFIGWDGKRPFRCFNQKHYIKYPSDEGGPTYRDVWTGDYYDSVMPENPTHWMPLPSAPAGGGDE